MAKRALIDEFLTHRKLALVRFSAATPVRGVKIDEELGSKGYTISVVYLDEQSPESGLSGLKDQVDGVIIAVPSKHAEKAVRQAIGAKIPRVWLQRGAESKTAIALCEEQGIPVVHGECVLMYAEPVKSFHSFHRWLWKTLGLLSK
jgi:predicted CoA-binding protein